MKEITRIRAGKKSAFPDMIVLKDQQVSNLQTKEISIRVMEVYLSERDIYIPRDKYGISLHCLQYFGQFGQMFTKFKIETHIHFLEH